MAVVVAGGVWGYGVSATLFVIRIILLFQHFLVFGTLALARTNRLLLWNWQVDRNVVGCRVSEVHLLD